MHIRRGVWPPTYLSEDANANDEWKHLQQLISEKRRVRVWIQTEADVSYQCEALNPGREVQTKGFGRSSRLLRCADGPRTHLRRPHHRQTPTLRLRLRNQTPNNIQTPNFRALKEQKWQNLESLKTQPSECGSFTRLRKSSKKRPWPRLNRDKQPSIRLREAPLPRRKRRKRWRQKQVRTDV